MAARKLSPRPQALLFRANVNMPPGGLFVDASPVLLSVNFGMSFSWIERVTCEIQFMDDLFDPGERWYIDQFGGTINNSTVPAPESRLDSVDCWTRMQFMDGELEFDLRFEIGKAIVSSVGFEVWGVG